MSLMADSRVVMTRDLRGSCGARLAGRITKPLAKAIADLGPSGVPKAESEQPVERTSLYGHVQARNRPRKRHRRRSGRFRGRSTGGRDVGGIVRSGRKSVQAARFRLPIGRHLWRVPQHLRLRAARRLVASKCQGRVVEGHGAGARRRCRPGRVDPVAAAGVGGLGAFGELHRSARRLQEVPRSASPRQAGGSGSLPHVRQPGNVHRAT